MARGLRSSRQMLDLGKETLWGLYALHHLAETARPTSAPDIARHGGIPRDKLGRILRRLRGAGLIRGRSGHGYVLAKAADAISVLDVARVMESRSSPAKNCMTRYDQCAYKESCALAPLCIETHDRSEEAMRSFSVADLRRSPAEVPDCAGPRGRRTPAARSRG